MSSRLSNLVLPLFFVSIFCQAQSLGDVARDTRAQEEKDGISHPKVITNEDIAQPAQAKETAISDGAQAQNGTEDQGEAAEEPSTGDAETWKLEIQQLDWHYLERIASLRGQINAAQLELGRLEVDRLDAANDFTPGTNFSPAGYETQMLSLNDQIEAEHSMIARLKAELKDAREGARHAGVPHPDANSMGAGRSAETEKWYLDRIATLREQINTAQQELAKLQGKPLGSNEFGRTIAHVPFWEMQVTAPELKAEIEAQRRLIVSLKAQLREAREEARHAGVRHAAN